MSDDAPLVGLLRVGPIRGSCFAVDERHVLTAFHNVADAVTGLPDNAVRGAQILFSSGRTRHVNVQGVIASNADEDWALLETDSIELRPWVLAQRPAAQNENGQVVGHSDGALSDAPAGNIASMRVLRSAFPYQGSQSAIHLGGGPTGDAVGGYSGAPLVADDGTVLGVVRAFDRDEQTGRSTTGRAYAAPALSILAEIEPFLPLDPVLGMPPLAVMPPWPEEPYRWLNEYTENDLAVYFGRSDDVRKLYELVQGDGAHRVVVLSGAAGTGKSSLVRAGIVPRLRAHATTPHRVVYHTSLASLALELGTSFDNPAPWAEAWQAAERDTPLTVVLDRAEALLSDESLRDGRAPQIIQSLARATTQGRLLISLREERFGRLDRLLRDADVSWQRHFLFHLSREQIGEVVAAVPHRPKYARHYRTTAPPDLPMQIASAVEDDASRRAHVAPFLQLLLKRMWDEAIVDPERGTASQSRRFTGELFDEVKLGAHLRVFLSSQVAVAESAMSGAAGRAGMLLEVLRTCSDATASKTLSRAEVDELFASNGRTSGDVTSALVLLESAHLLALGREGDVVTEVRLAHDTLAPYVRELAETSPAPAQRGRRLLARMAPSDVADGVLTRSDLALMDEARPGMSRLGPEVEALLARSRARHRLVFLIVSIVAISLLSVLSGVSWQLHVVEAERQATAAERRHEAFWTSAREETLTGDVAGTFGAALRAMDDDVGPLERLRVLDMATRLPAGFFVIDGFSPQAWPDAAYAPLIIDSATGLRLPNVIPSGIFAPRPTPRLSADRRSVVGVTAAGEVGRWSIARRTMEVLGRLQAAAEEVEAIELLGNEAVVVRVYPGAEIHRPRRPVVVVEEPCAGPGALTLHEGGVRALRCRSIEWNEIEESTATENEQSSDGSEASVDDDSPVDGLERESTIEASPHTQLVLTTVDGAGAASDVHVGSFTDVVEAGFVGDEGAFEALVLEASSDAGMSERTSLARVELGYSGDSALPLTVSAWQLRRWDSNGHAVDARGTAAFTVEDRASIVDRLDPASWLVEVEIGDTQSELRVYDDSGEYYYYVIDAWEGGSDPQPRFGASVGEVILHTDRGLWRVWSVPEARPISSDVGPHTRALESRSTSHEAVDLTEDGTVWRWTLPAKSGPLGVVRRFAADTHAAAPVTVTRSEYLEPLPFGPTSGSYAREFRSVFCEGTVSEAAYTIVLSRRSENDGRFQVESGCWLSLWGADGFVSGFVGTGVTGAANECNTPDTVRAGEALPESTLGWAIDPSVVRTTDLLRFACLAEPANHERAPGWSIRPSEWINEGRVRTLQEIAALVARRTCVGPLVAELQVEAEAGNAFAQFALTSIPPLRALGQTSVDSADP